ncbi:14406_t:CDS:2 [Cetraspora pellucida]|uniref:14406_t:CDS:1 n=1 Tax=Cetraspora pellucida TaxID=1433469 RepID=A0ACA9LW34_9GLOM|nr:14406_t:CDS:2 [Cetraspora pellucida]
MSYITKSSKDAKFSDNYNEIIKNLSLILDKDDNKKSQQLATLLDESAKLTKEKTEKQQAITKKTSKKNELKHLILHQKGVEREKARILGQTAPNMPSVTTDKSAWNADNGAWNSFHGKKADDNLYKVKGESFHITEDEAIKLLSRIIYELGRIKKTDFAAKHGLTGADKTAIEAQLDRLIEQSTAIKEMNEKGATNPFNFNDLDFVAKLNDTLVNNLDQSDAYTEEELADYGITVSDSSKTTLYKSTKKEADNQAKIRSSFPTTPNPVQQLFTDLRSQGAVDANFNTHYRLPESSDALDDLIAQLEADKTVSAVTNADLAKEIQELKKAIAEKESEIISKKSVLDGLVGEILTKKREKLNSYNISKGFAKTASEDNRRNVSELYQIQQLLLEIRYLENDGDASVASTVDAENTALTEIETILKEAGYYGGTTTFLVDYFRDLAFVAGNPEKFDIPQAISRIKAGKYTDGEGKEQDVRLFGDLTKFKTHFENKEKLIAQVETLLKKVIGSDGKIKSEFLEEIKKSDATLVDLKSLLQKEPKDIITYIARFVYNQLDDNASDEKNKKKTQMKRRIAKKLNKSNESELTEQELNDSLYKLEIGELTIDNTKYYKADLMAIFWKNIKGWWDGPAEEEGQTTDTSEESEEDDKE